MHVSSTEPAILRALGDCSTLPEKYGVDFLWHHRGWCGVQRKEVKDFIASMNDGRLARELKQMAPLRARLLIVEGSVHMVGDDVRPPNQRHATTTQAQWMGALWKVQSEGCWVTHTPNVEVTARVVAMFESWTRKDHHSSLSSTRDVVPRNSWGQVGSRDFGVHLLSGLPGVGVEMAGRIYDHFGEVPWRWTVGEEELCEVAGVGKTRARRMMAALETTTEETDGTTTRTRTGPRTRSKRRGSSRTRSARSR